MLQLTLALGPRIVIVTLFGDKARPVGKHEYKTTLNVTVPFDMPDAVVARILKLYVPALAVLEISM